MAGKARVHELAKELGVTSKELLATLKEQGEFVKSAKWKLSHPPRSACTYAGKWMNGGEVRCAPSRSNASFSPHLCAPGTGPKRSQRMYSAIQEDVLALLEGFCDISPPT